jgi:hypothetical protein
VRFEFLATLVVVVSLPVIASPARAQSLGPAVTPAFAPALWEAARAVRGGESWPVTETLRGEFTALTYNVAGIPQFFSDRQPARHNPLIGPLLNAYDLVLLQEDFIYHAEISAGATHAHRAPPHPLTPSFVTLGDGLSQFSQLPFEGFERVAWTVCSGLLGRMSDCTARKGFTFSRVELAPGLTVDVYNLHLDAGRAERDFTARTIQIAHLLEAVSARSAGRSVIVAGDTNMWRRGSDAFNLERLREELGLRDACEELACGWERIDRVLYRSGGEVILRASRYRIPEEFVDERGYDLSDHHPVAVHFEWEHAPTGVAAGP